MDLNPSTETKKPSNALILAILAEAIVLVVGFAEKYFPCQPFPKCAFNSAVSLNQNSLYLLILFVALLAGAKYLWRRPQMPTSVLAFVAVGLLILLFVLFVFPK